MQRILVACNSRFESNVRDGRPLESAPAAQRIFTTGSDVTLHEPPDTQIEESPLDERPCKQVPGAPLMLFVLLDIFLTVLYARIGSSLAGRFGASLLPFTVTYTLGMTCPSSRA